MNCSPILTFIIFRSHLMEVERNQFSFVLKEACFCVGLPFQYVHVLACCWVAVGGCSPFFFLCSFPHSFLSLYLSIMYDSHLLLFCVHFSFLVVSPRLSQRISELLNEDSQHFLLPDNTLSKRKSRSRKSIFFYIIKSSSTALACVIPLV